MKKIYGSEVVKHESVGKIFRGKGLSRKEIDVITLRAMKGLIYGFYSPSPWTVWLRVDALPYGVEVTRFGHLVWWKRYSIKVLRATS